MGSAVTLVWMSGSSVIYASDKHGSLLRSVLPAPCILVRSDPELMTAAAVRGRVTFVDIDRLGQVDHRALGSPTVAVMDQSPVDALAATVRILDTYPWLSHVLQATLLTAPKAGEHLQLIRDRLLTGRQQFMLGPTGVGRVALLNQASHRGTRFKRIHEFFESHGVSERILTTLNDVCEELVMNALYNAPTEAGYFKTPVSRTEDVTLPMDRACEISYGIEAGHAFVRLRDTFGSLRRQRLFEVLARCNKDAVSLDESRGGAGLGIWRVFTVATTIAITVIPGRLTDVLVRMMPKTSKAPKHLLAVDLYFLADSDEASEVLVVEPDSALVDHSVTMIQN